MRVQPSQKIIQTDFFKDLKMDFVCYLSFFCRKISMKVEEKLIESRENWNRTIFYLNFI